MSKSTLPRAVREYLQRIGKRGGAAKGRAKVRGGPEHYRAMARARWGAAKVPPGR